MAVENLNEPSNSEETPAAEKPSRTRSRKTTAAATASNPATTSASVALFGIAPYQLKAGEEYMSDAQMVHFRRILDAWKADLMQEVDRTVNYMQDESAALPDVNDRATQEEEFAIELRTRDRERKLIRKIEQSIQAINDGDYGYCDTCGIEIGLRRLEARPTATQCIDCKTLAEIKEKQNHG
jgi:DnaK suppressor protein